MRGGSNSLMAARVSVDYLLILNDIPALSQDAAASLDARANQGSSAGPSLPGALSALSNPSRSCSCRYFIAWPLFENRTAPVSSPDAVHRRNEHNLWIRPRDPVTRSNSLIELIDRDHIFATSLLSVRFRLRSPSESADCARFRTQQGPNLRSSERPSQARPESRRAA
jgi:hypothetical protein